MDIQLVQNLPDPLPASVAFWWSNIANGYRIQLRSGAESEVVIAPSLYIDRSEVLRVVESVSTQYNVPVFEVDILKITLPLRED